MVFGWLMLKYSLAEKRKKRREQNIKFSKTKARLDCSERKERASFVSFIAALRDFASSIVPLSLLLRFFRAILSLRVYICVRACIRAVMNRAMTGENQFNSVVYLIQ